MLIFNTLGRKKEVFLPQEKKLTIYVCGLTPYDSCHIGHARCYVFFDVVQRVFRKKGYNVVYVQNFTDIDDKIIKRAEEENVSPKEIVQRYIDEYFLVMDQLGVQRADHYPRVTEHIPEIIDCIDALIKKGYAYKIGADVYFDTERVSEYGVLSSKKIEDLMNFHRILPNPKKKNPLDFALWKEDEKWGWPSPFGKGRPGWHIECTVLSEKYLGIPFHIHGGGSDLVFPHHENEIAQSIALWEKIPANVWMHVNHLTIKGEKMSKSAQNIITVSNLLKKYSPSVLRLYLLLTHYRSPMEFTEEGIRNAALALERIEATLSRMCTYSHFKKAQFKELSSFVEEFWAHIDDDFNTPAALACVFKVCTKLNEAMQKREENIVSLVQEGWSFYEMVDSVFGIFLDKPLESFRLIKPNEEGLEGIDDLLSVRGIYRKQKMYKEADKIRKKLEKNGIIIDDYPEGSVWRKKRLA